jgi:hypothetical protein
VGPEYSQRLITFDNGTCLSFGPDVSTRHLSYKLNRSPLLSDLDSKISSSSSLEHECLKFVIS